MKSNQRVTLLQATFVIFAVTIGTVYFPVAGIVVPLAGPAGSVSVLLAFGAALPWLALAVWLCRQAPTGNWGEAVHSLLGPWLGRLFLLYLAFIWAWLGGHLLAQAGFVFHFIALERTPPAFIAATLVVLVLLTDLRGLEVFARTVEVSFMLGLLLGLGFMIGVIPSLELNNLRPFWAEGRARIAHAAYLSLPWAMEGVLFTFFLGTHVKRKERLLQATLPALLGAGLFLSLVTLLTLGTLGRGVTESYIYPTIVLAQTAHVGFFLQGLELFVFPLWLISSYVKVTAAFVLTSHSLEGVYAGFAQPYRSLILAVIFFAQIFIHNNLPETVASLSRVDNTFFMFSYAILPVLILAALRNRRRKQNAA